ncbi:MAG: hypothetical protein IRY83_17865 [Chloroflexi bacterium]|nr:hypothetical protein [Chloroflexota bacterium]
MLDPRELGILSPTSGLPSSHVYALLKGVPPSPPPGLPDQTNRSAPDKQKTANPGQTIQDRRQNSRACLVARG